MSKINYVVREDRSPKMIHPKSDFDFIDTEEVLKDYPYILNSMDKENYYLENVLCDAFDEILFEDKVVGFATFELREPDVFLLTECYILPEFRGNMLFFNEICKIIFAAPKFGILQPTRKLVELLKDYAFAKDVDNNIVVSAIDLYFDEIDAKSNKRDEIFENDLPLSNFYDLSICSTILVDGDEVFYHDLLENDLRSHGERIVLTEDYFTNIKDLFSKNQNEFEELVNELKNELPDEDLGYDVVVGYGTDLSEYMWGMVDRGMMDYDKAMEIRQQLIKEYESGEIDDKTIDDRLTALMIGRMSDDTFDDLFDSYDDEHLQNFKGLMDMLGDNEEVKSEIVEAILLEDEDKFSNALLTAMSNDEEFFNNFMDLADEDIDDEIFPILDDDLNLDSPYPIAEMMWGDNDAKYKLDDTFYGKDHPISFEIYFYRVLNSLKELNNLKIALALADIDGAMMLQLVESLLFQLDFIDDSVTYDNWNEFAHDSLTVNDLKDFLRENNLKVSGKKQELIDRVSKNHLPLDSFRNDKVIVTSEGEEFLQNNAWIKVYDNLLDKFDFNDFVKFLEKDDDDFIDSTLKYLKKHLELAKKQNDPEYIKDCNIAYSILSELGDDVFNSLDKL